MCARRGFFMIVIRAMQTVTGYEFQVEVKDGEIIVALPSQVRRHVCLLWQLPCTVSRKVCGTRRSVHAKRSIVLAEKSTTSKNSLS